jgi:uncharacterized protein
MNGTAYFADSWFWIGLIHEPDPHHQAAIAMHKKIGRSPIVTSEMVLTEVLNVFRKFGPRWRTICCNYIDLLRRRAEISVFAQTTDQFQRGLIMYRQHDDKEWSLVASSIGHVNGSMPSARPAFLIAAQSSFKFLISSSILNNLL